MCTSNFSLRRQYVWLTGLKRRKVNETQQINSNLAMDERLWSMLPEHLLDRILARLPLPSLLYVRPVCKRWSTLLSTPSFLDVCTEVPQKPSLLGIFENGEHGWLTHGCSTFCSKSQRWFSIDLKSLPYKEGDLLAAAEGLFCYVPQSDGENEDCLVVCNPLTRAWRSILLPEGIQMITLLAITVDNTTRAYKIIVTALMQKLEGPRLDACNLTTQVYDSLTRTWKVAGDLPPSLLFPLHSVLCNGSLYSWCSKADQVWVYDIVRGLWRGEKLCLPEDAMSSNVQLVECQGSLFLVTETGYSGISPQIWELNCETMLCTLVTQVPQEAFQEFFENVCEFQCMGYNDAICFMAHESADVLMYHLSKKKWQWILRCPKFPEWHPYGYVGVALTLRLDVVV